MPMKEFAVRPPFASVGGKYRVRKHLVALMSEHEVYVEPYAGAANVLYGKEPSEKEIISDIDKWIYFAHKKIKGITEDDIEKLKGYNWVSSKQRFNNIKTEYEPKSDLDKLYKFLYLNWIGYGNKGTDVATYWPSQSGKSFGGRIDKLLTASKRLKDVIILNKDAIEVIKEYDSKDSIMFIDPPYHDDWGDIKDSMGQYDFDLEKFADAIKSIKGKFIITYSDTKEVRSLFKQFETKVHSYRRTMSKDNQDKELIITNYPQKKSDWSSGVTIEGLKKSDEIDDELLNDNYYLVEENGKKHQFVIQYHVRGIWTRDEIEPLQMALAELKEGKVGNHTQALVKVAEKPQDALEILFKQYNCIYLTSSLEELSKVIQVIDDKHGDVSAEAKKYYTDKAPEYSKLDLDKVYNLGNVHADLRFEEPDSKYLVGFTQDTVKMVFQSLSDELYFPLRDRVLENKDVDQWLCQKKGKISNQWLTITTKDNPVYDADDSDLGRFLYKASGQIVYGVTKTDYFEYFLFFDDEQYEYLNGRWDFKLIPDATKDDYWLGSKLKSQTPYILTHDKVEEEAKAKEDEVEIIWNDKTIEVLESLNYEHLGDIEKFNLYMPILKRDDEKQIVIGPVLVPDKFDHQNDIITVEAIEEAAYWHAEHGQQIKLMHEGRDLRFPRVETYLYRELKNVPEGTWMLGIKVTDKGVWKDIKDGKITGYSIGGTGTRRKAGKWLKKI